MGLSFEPYLVLNDASLDPLVLVAGLQRHEVHAALAAVVPGAQPVLLYTAESGISP